jgi:hypothetical protein
MARLAAYVAMDRQTHVHTDWQTDVETDGSHFWHDKGGGWGGVGEGGAQREQLANGDF